MADNRSIGIFDSGLGGLTVLSAMLKKFPNESFVYLGDTARVPYGNRSPKAVERLALSNACSLLERAELKLLIIACNTATAYGIKALQEQLQIPVVGVIEPGVKALVALPQVERVAVLGTAGTIRSGAYQQLLQNIGFSGQVESLACPLWVPLIEEGLVEGPMAERVAEYYLAQLKAKPQAVILGCTHYPLLLPVLRGFLSEETLWVNSGSSVVSDLHFEANDLDESPSVRYLVTDGPERFRDLSTLFLGKPVREEQVELINLGAF
ncbi:MAG: glutamate racemase [Deltaproteobacteria bacterium]|nr:glutamate racemase [Deltaproteobacteria bacterium]